MLKFKDLKKKFTIIYETDDMTENHIIEEVLTEREKELVYLGDFNKGDIFILDSDTDIEEWNEMLDIVDEEEWKENSEKYGLSNYFSYIQNMEKLKPPVDEKKYYEIPKGLSEYERNKVKYTPTHFTFTPETNERLKGFDKVTYYRKKIL